MQAFLVRERYSGGQHPTALMAKLRSAPRARSGARARRAPAARAHLRGDDPDAERPDQGPRAPDPQPGPRPPGRADLPLAVQIAQQRDHRRRAPRGDRRLPRALPHPGRARRRRRPGRRREGVRKWKTAGFRRACNKRLRVAFCRLADSSRHWHPWAQTSTPRRASAATNTPARSVPSAAPGAASCGNAGATTPLRPHTTPRATTPHHRHHPNHVGPGAPTSPPPSGWPAPLSPHGRPARAERQRLTQAAIRYTPEVDTGRLRRPNATPPGMPS